MLSGIIGDFDPHTRKWILGIRIKYKDNTKKIVNNWRTNCCKDIEIIKVYVQEWILITFVSKICTLNKTNNGWCSWETEKLCNKISFIKSDNKRQRFCSVRRQKFGISLTKLVYHKKQSPLVTFCGRSVSLRKDGIEWIFTYVSYIVLYKADRVQLEGPTSEVLPRISKIPVTLMNSVLKLSYKSEKINSLKMKVLNKLRLI